jgi:hypothetical protein
MSERTSWTIYESPFGPLALEAGPRGLRGLHFPGGSGHLDERDRLPAAEAAGVLADAATQLAEYFARERSAFELELDLGGTPFQRDQAATDVPASARPQRPGTPVSATWPSSAGTWGSLRSPAGVGARPSIVVSASSGAAAAQACGAEAVG